MKKLSFFLMAMLFSVMSFAAEAKFDWSGITTTQSPTVANVYTQGDVTLTFEKASGSNIPAENKEGSIRMYKGTTLKIVVAGENNVITNVAFTCTGASYAATNLQYNGAALPSNEWALTTPAAEILLNAVANARFKSIVVTYGQVAADYIAAPAISGDVDFIESTEVSIAAGEGLKVYYTLDGTDPTNASPEYTAPFEVKETTTVKAIAYNGENASEVTTQTFTKATQVTCAEAKEIALKVSGNNVPTELTYVVKGYVTNIVGDWKSGKQSFWIADTKDGGNVFEAYYCFISKAVTLGDYVQLFGKLTKFNTTPEMADGQATILPEPAPEPTGVTYNVTVPAGTYACYIAGEMNDWKQQEMTKVDDTNYTITIEGATTAMKYKYCSGPDWKYVEKTTENQDVQDRTYTENDVVAAWAEVYNPNPTVEPEATWTVAGSPATLFGTEWDPANTANDMNKQEDGTYKWEKTDVELAASSIEFKVAKNHAWTEAYPGSNYNLAIAESGKYTITITFNAETKEVNAVATLQEVVEIIPTIAIAGDMNGWNTTANEFVMAEDKLTATLALTLEAKDYGFKMIIAGGWTSDAATITRENNSATFVNNGDNSTLVADVAGEYTFTWTYATNTLTVTYPVVSEPEYEIYEEEITNLVIDYDNMLLKGGPSANFLVEVTLGLGEYNRNDDTFQLLPESSISVQGSDATFVEGYATVDGIAQTVKAVVRCLWNDMAIEFHLSMSAAPLEATVVVVENAVVEIEKYLLFGDMYDYALKMTGVWTNEGVDYPVLVEVPVYYPEATEPSIIFSTVTVGGMGDDDPWLGFGEGDLTITTVDNTITATGIVENPMAGIAIDITISGTITPSGVENATVTINPVKMIQNGQLIIIKNDVQYNAQGAVVK